MNLLIKKLPTLFMAKIKKKVLLLPLTRVSKDGCDKTELSKQNDELNKINLKLSLFEKDNIKESDSSSTQSSSRNLIINVFVKQLRLTDHQKLYQFFDQSSLAAKNEAIMYKIIIPHLNVYQVTSLPVPFCYSADYKQLLLEDLCQSNYKPFDLKNRFITMKECIFTLKALAKFHGATMVFKHKNGSDSEIVKMITKGILYDNPDLALSKHRQDRLQNILSIYKSRKPSEENATKIEALKHLIKVAKNDFKDLLSYEKDKYVLCHGNLLLTNFLYKPIEIQTEGRREIEEIDIKFVDFQKVLYSSVASDLVYLLFINLNPDEYIAYKDYLLSQYLKYLIDFTEECDMHDLTLNLEWLHTEIDRFTEYGIINALLFIPMLEGDNSRDTREVTNEILDENLKQVFLNERMEKWVDYYSKIFKKKSQEQLFVV